WSAPLTPKTVRQTIADVMRPGSFFAKPPVTLEFQPDVKEEIPWELFHGRLLDETQTRRTQRFAAWNVYRKEGNERSTAPLLSIKLDETAREIHVTRAIHSYVQEAYDAGGQVFLTRNAQRWLMELIATISIDDFHDTVALRDEL